MSAHLPWFSKNAVALGAVAALSVGVLAACSSSGGSSSSSSSSTTSASAASTGSSTGSKAPITIGISLSETGDFSADGLAFKQGYQLWAKDVNAAGGILGRPVQLTILNDDSSTNQVVTNYNTLISADHVDLTFGPFSSLLTGPASAVAARAGYAFVEGAGGAPTVFDTQSNEADHNTFDVSLPIADEMLPFVNYIKSLGSTVDHSLTAAYPMANDPFADPPVQLAQTELQALGVKTVYSEIFPEEPSSYAPAASAVAGKTPDIVVLGSTDVPTVAAFMQGFQQAHYTPKLFIAAAGPDQGAAFIKASGVAANAAAMMVPDGWYGGYVNAESQKMVAEYIKQYGGTASDVNADVAEAYSVGQVVEQAITHTGGTDNKAIIAYLHSGVTLNTVQGNVLFNSLGENSAAAAFVFQWNKTGTVFNQVLPKSDPGTKVAIIATKPGWAGSV
ncbi:MAG: ABC transporter substrate-binding protein [Trebonia sp.]|jgi:branched-chain amino acid transport system substrate-binding protein